MQQTKQLGKYDMKIINPIISDNFTGAGKNLFVYDKKDDNARKKSIDFHVEANDYFGTLATIINFLIQRKEILAEQNGRVLKDLKNDLMYLQKKYRIVKK